jgi:hypothetical protein
MRRTLIQPTFLLLMGLLAAIALCFLLLWGCWQYWQWWERESKPRVNVSDFRANVMSELPNGSSRAEVTNWLSKRGMAQFEFVDNDGSLGIESWIQNSGAPIETMGIRDIRIRLIFDNKGLLTCVTVQEEDRF